MNSLKSRFAGKSADVKEATASIDVSGKSVQEIEAMVTEQGNKVRSLKQAKAEKDVVLREVEVLKFLKAAASKAATQK